MKTVLIISPESWDAHTVSKHHYATTLAEVGYKVLFLNPPDHSLKEVLIDNTDYPRLSVVSAPKVARGLRFFPSSIRAFLERRWLKKLEILSGTGIDIIWLFENSRFFDMRFADERIKVYHQVDLNQEFNTKVAALTADICFAVNNVIKDKLENYSNKVFKITHGVNEPKELVHLGAEEQHRFDLPGIHAVYVGNIDIPYLDLTLLTRVVEQFPTVNFHFVGGYSEECEAWRLLKNVNNVNWWGKVNSNVIPSILEKSDILLVCYDTKQWEYVASSHKFMEYFSSGKVIVSTYTDEYKDKRHLLEMTEDSADYISVFSNVVHDLKKYNSNGLRATRIDFARSHTYRKQLEKIFKLIKKSGFVLDDCKRE